MEISDILKDKRVRVAAASVVALGATVGIIYLLKKRHNRKQETVITEESEQLSFLDKGTRVITDMVIESISVEADGGFPNTSVALVRSIDESFDDPEYDPEEDTGRAATEEELAIALTQEDIKRELHNVFEANKDLPVWDHDAEVAKRTKTEPYVIHISEFEGDELGYHQETVTYYAGDDILADFKDMPVYNHGQLLGELKFGHGSNDSEVVYIRNDAKKLEWEVLRHSGTYAYEVLGQQYDDAEQEELKHSLHAPKKFREE